MNRCKELLEIFESLNEANKLLGSASSEEGIINLINKFWYTNSVKLEPIDNKSWKVHNSKGVVNGFIVKLKSGRYRFESIRD